MGKFNLNKIISILFAGCLILLEGCTLAWWQKYPQDNFVEEIVEEVIKEEIGIDIDLSPKSKENG